MGVEQALKVAFIAVLTLTVLTATMTVETTVLAFPSSTSQVQNGMAINGCAIRTPTGLLQDRDCDGVSDAQDNCIATPNAEQSDSNRNGIGDACDLLVTQIDLEPGTEVKQGEFFTVRVQLINNKEYEVDDVEARIRNNGLKIDVSTLIPSLRPGEQHTVEFVLKAPGCATPGRYELTFSTNHAEGAKRYTQTTYQRINVVEREGACHKGATVLDNTLLDTITQQEAEPGERVLYPITITNLNGEAKTYALSISPINNLGTYSIDPSPTFTIPAGKRHTVYLSVETEKFAQPGRHTLTLNVESEGKSSNTTVILRIIKSARPPLVKVITSALQLGLVLLVLALIIGAGFVAYKKLNEDHDYPPRDDDEDSDDLKIIQNREKDGEELTGFSKEHSNYENEDLSEDSGRDLNGGLNEDYLEKDYSEGAVDAGKRGLRDGKKGRKEKGVKSTEKGAEKAKENSVELVDDEDFESYY